MYRLFIAITISLTILCQPVIIQAEERKLLIVAPGAHADLSGEGFRFRYTEQIKDHIEFIEKNPDFSYSIGNTYNIQHFLETYPKYKPRLKKLMQKDRISAPALWVDLEPEWYTGEFLVRSVAYAKYFLKNEFGYDTKWSHLNDVPSITPQWAQILKKSDIDMLILNPERMPHIPRIFYYGAPDGSRILSWSSDYSDLIDLDFSLLAGNSWVNRMSILGYNLAQATQDYGIDLDQSRELLKNYRRWNSQYPDRTLIRLGTVQEFAEMATNTIKGKIVGLPELTGRAFTWPWAGEAWSKEAMRNHATAENLLPITEKLSAICELLGLEKYPLEEITHGWELILWGPDHNWGPGVGTGGMKAQDNKESCEIVRRLLNQKLNRLASAVKYADKGKPLFVFNPLNWLRTEPVTVELPAGKISEPFSVIDSNGKATLAQISSGKKSDPLKITFLAQDVPSMGYKCYYLINNSAGSQPQTDIKTGHDFIENQYYIIKADKNKGISSIYDKLHKHELIDQNARYQLGFSDISRGNIVPPFIPVQDIRVTAQGPLQASLQVVFISDNKPCIATISLSANNWNIDFKLDRGIARCITFPFNVENSKYNIMMGLAFGCIPDVPEEQYNYKAFRRLPERAFNDNFTMYLHYQPMNFCNVAQMWLTQGGASGDDYAVDVALDSIEARTYIFNIDRKKIPAVHVWGNPPGTLDYHFIIRGHPGDWKAAHTPRLGWEVNNPLLVTAASAGAGKLPEETSFITLEPEPKGQNIILSAFKKAFDGNGYVLRFYESEDVDANVAVTINPQLGIPRAEVSRTNMVEKPSQVMDSGAKSHTIPVLGFGIETMRFFQTAVTDLVLPAKINDLKVFNPSPTSVELAWTATGDDGKKGRAAAYDLRYARQPITNNNWAEASKVNYSPAPKDSGAREQFKVSGLEAETKYYFAIKAGDETDNYSPISNLAETTTPPPDTTPPAQITDLRAIGIGGSSITLNWTAPGDNGTQGKSARYDLRYSIAPVDATTWFMAAKADKLIPPAPAGKKESFELSGLEPNSSYYIALKSADVAGNESPISNILHQNTKQTKSLTLQNGFNPTPDRGVQDTYISNINPEEREINNSKGHIIELWEGGGRVGLIKFDLSLLPPRARIYRARLKLYCLNVTYFDAGTVQCYRLTQNWRDDEATWKLAMGKIPWKGKLRERVDTISDYGLKTNGLIGQADVKNGGMWVIWDVTKVLQEWNDGKYPNYGWLIKGKCSEDCGINFCSSEYKKNTDLRPVLEIKYD